MTPEEFIAEAKRRGKSREETLAKYTQLKASGAFTSPDEDIPAAPDYRTSMQEAINGQRAPKQPQSDSFSDNALDVLGEFAASANRSVTELVDFLGPNAVNSILSLSGSQQRVPTLTAVLGEHGIGQGGFMERGPARDAVQSAGKTAVMGGGLVSVPRSAATVGGAVADILGLGSSALTAPVKHGARALADTASQALQKPPPLDVELALKRKSGAASSFGYELTEEGAKKSPQQAAAAKQGIQESLITMVRDSTPKAREKYRAMVDTVVHGKEFLKDKARPQDIAGESIANRARVVKAANDSAASRLDDVAKSLKGQPVDPSPAIDQFLADLDSMGIKFNARTATVDFGRSDIEGLKGIEDNIGRVIQRLRDTHAPDAHDVHRMKRFIDQSVTYGKSAEGLAGKAEAVVKSLRHNLDALLDAQFPAYNEVNSQYAETISALNAMGEIAGKRISLTDDFAGTALGTLSRRILGNAQSRTAFEKSLREIDAVAKKYVTPSGSGVIPYRPIAKRTGITLDDLDDDLVGQIVFANEMDRMFGTAAKTSFQGDIAKAVDGAVEGGKVGAARKAGKSLIDRARGINEENALKALIDLLKD